MLVAERRQRGREQAEGQVHGTGARDRLLGRIISVLGGISLKQLPSSY